MSTTILMRPLPSRSAVRILPPTMKKAVRAVVVDFGNVMSLPVDPNAFESLAEISNMNFEGFALAYRSNRTDFDRGTINGHAYWSRILSLGDVAPTADIIENLIRADIDCWTNINSAMVDWVIRLKREGIKTAVLSNMPADILEYIESVFPWLAELDARVYSCNVGSVKPELEIYRHCLQALGVPAAEVLFLDDSADNTKAALALGINALTFESPQQAQRIIEQSYQLPALV